MVKLGPTLEKNCLWSVRNGRIVDFRKHAWIDDKLKLSDLQLAIPKETKHVKVVELLDDRGAWNWSLIQYWVPDHIMHKIAAILPPEDTAGVDQVIKALKNLMLRLRLTTPTKVEAFSAVNLLADTHTDEVVLKLLLTPTNGDVQNNVQEPEQNADDNVVSYGKVLTQSHCYSSTFIPISCATLILPHLDTQDPKACQLLPAHVVHGNVWNINHTRSANRHLFTMGGQNS
ncbi:hypothetical protein TSUD_00750 [Trifolium subterraneum]|nr:hypothetical protein TSUD_00750 [Trifolium subterraneum]